MHIPGCLTTEVEPLYFDRALEASLVPCPDYDVSKRLYAPNTYQEYRYLLGSRASGTWLRQGRRTAQAGIPPGPDPNGGVPITPFTCAKTAF